MGCGISSTIPKAEKFLKHKFPPPAHGFLLEECGNSAQLSGIESRPWPLFEDDTLKNGKGTKKVCCDDEECGDKKVKKEPTDPVVPSPKHAALKDETASDLPDLVDADKDNKEQRADPVPMKALFMRSWSYTDKCNVDLQGKNGLIEIKEKNEENGFEKVNVFGDFYIDELPNMIAAVTIPNTGKEILAAVDSNGKAIGKLIMPPHMSHQPRGGAWFLAMNKRMDTVALIRTTNDSKQRKKQKESNAFNIWVAQPEAGMEDALKLKSIGKEFYLWNRVERKAGSVRECNVYNGKEELTGTCQTFHDHRSEIVQEGHGAMNWKHQTLDKKGIATSRKDVVSLYGQNPLNETRKFFQMCEDNRCIKGANPLWKKNESNDGPRHHMQVAEGVDIIREMLIMMAHLMCMDEMYHESAEEKAMKGTIDDL